MKVQQRNMVQVFGKKKTSIAIATFREGKERYQ